MIWMRRLTPAAAPVYAMAFDPGTVLFTVGTTEVTLGAVATGASIAGTALSAASAVKQGNAQKSMMDYNARVAERQGQMARQAADLEEARQRNRTDKLLSSQRAAVAASGLDLEGSPLLVMEESAAQSELDALLIRHSGSVAEAQANSQAAADRMSGRAAKMQGYYSAGASLLSGASSVVRAYGPFSTPAKASNNLGFTRNPGGIDAQ